jgi:late competence protein required for DNA uptake (superfamily II DNA/RNA helicase)
MKPGQSECQRCEKLFVFFYRTNKPIYCRSCNVIERIEASAFFNARVRIERLLKRREEMRA